MGSIDEYKYNLVRNAATTATYPEDALLYLVRQRCEIARMMQSRELNDSDVRIIESYNRDICLLLGIPPANSNGKVEPVEMNEELAESIRRHYEIIDEIRKSISIPGEFINVKWDKK